MLKSFFQTIWNMFAGLAYDSKHRYEIAEELVTAVEKRRALSDRDEMIKEKVDID